MSKEVSDSSKKNYDYGYTGINAAFVQDLLAALEEREAPDAGTVSDSAIARRADAKKIREEIVAALSGGGFRALLFHIGVLARLAELDLVRSVEVLSCVSGGSIIGAHYYLEVQ